METSERTVSEYNENAFATSRLHNIWLDARNNRENGNLLGHKGYKWNLDSAEIELKKDAKKLDSEQGTTYVKTLKEINEKVNCSKTFQSLYYNLMEKEELLRDIQQDSGKGTTYKDIDEDMM